MYLFILLNKNRKETFKDCKSSIEIINKYKNIEKLPIINLKKEAKKSLKKMLLKELQININEIKKGNFNIIILYKKLNLISEYKILKKIKENYLSDFLIKILIKELKINENKLKTYKNENNFYELKKIEKLIIENKLNEKTIEEIEEFYKKHLKKLNKINKTYKKISKRILKILIISLKKKSLIIFSKKEKIFLKFVFFSIKNPENFLKNIYKENLSNQKSIDFIFNEKLFNKQEIAKFLIKNFNIFIKNLNEKFEFKIKKPKNLSKVYFLLKEFDEKKSEILENNIYILLCNFILKNQTINYNIFYYFKRMFNPLKKSSNFKRICLIYKLYIFNFNFKTNKQFIHLIDKSILLYFPSFNEINLDFSILNKISFKRLKMDNKKRIDLFCLIKIKIDNKIILITFVQFMLIKSFYKESLNKKYLINDKQLTLEDINYLFFKYKNNELKDNNKILIPHFLLIEPIINKYFSEFLNNNNNNKSDYNNNKKSDYIITDSDNFIPNFYSSFNNEDENLETNIGLNINANIIKICKKEKRIEKLNLFKKIIKLKISYAVFLKVIKDLEKKGYLKITNDFINYIP